MVSMYKVYPFFLNLLIGYILTAAAYFDQNTQQTQNDHMNLLYDSVSPTVDFDKLEIDYFEHNMSEPILEPCQAYLQLFAQAASNFTECLILNARPFRFCEGCVVHFTKATTVYSDLFNRKDKKCHNTLLRADRIQVLTLVYKNMNDVWDNADCKNCFKEITEDESGNVNYTLTEDTILFHYHFENVSRCLNLTLGGIEGEEKFWNMSDCIRCKSNYSSLNSYYEKIAKETSYHVCMDIIDMMNYTRLMWGKKLNCSHREGDKAPVIGISFLMAVIPVVYYVSNRIFGAKQEKSIVIQKRLRKPVQDYGTRSTSTSLQNTDYFSSLSS